MTGVAPGIARGITDLPAGTVAAIVTYLERTAPPAPAPPPPPGLRFAPIGPDAAGLARYRDLFGRIGARWLWFSRAGLDDAALRAILADPGVAAAALVAADAGAEDGGAEGEAIGLVEVDARAPDASEIAYLGLVPGREGRGLGDHLMARALATAFARPIARLSVHTCTLDHPGALGFYLRHGFRPVRRALELVPDPRLTGALPREAGSHHPVIEGE